MKHNLDANTCKSKLFEGGIDCALNNLKLGRFASINLHALIHSGITFFNSEVSSISGNHYIL